jgi:hypothetical protein
MLEAILPGCNPSHPPPPQRKFLNIHEMHTVYGTSVTFIAERVNELPNVSQNTVQY